MLDPRRFLSKALCLTIAFHLEPFDRARLRGLLRHLDRRHDRVALTGGSYKTRLLGYHRYDGLPDRHYHHPVWAACRSLIRISPFQFLLGQHP